MGILISNAVMATTLASLRLTNLPGTVSIQYASGPASQPGMTYVENGSQLVALLRRNGWPSGREMRAQWAPTPAAPAAVVAEVRSAMQQAGAGVDALGARAFTAGQSPVFGNNPDELALPHEATHVIQQRHGTQN